MFEEKAKKKSFLSSFLLLVLLLFILFVRLCGVSTDQNKSEKPASVWDRGAKPSEIRSHKDVLNF